jgi:hypothetical protein
MQSDKSSILSGGYQLKDENNGVVEELLFGDDHYFFKS